MDCVPVLMRFIPRVLLAGLFFISSVHASNIQVNPTQISLSPEHPIAVLSVKNENDDNLVMQLHAMQWSQKNKQDFFNVTHDVLVTPPLFELKPHQTQIIRLAIQKPLPTQEQHTYRVFLQEVIAETTAPQIPLTDNLRITLNISIPIFIQPVHTNQQFIWQAKWLDDKRLQLALNNTGNVTLFTNGWQVLDKDERSLGNKRNIFQYLLPHQEASWVIEPSRKTTPLLVKAQINAEQTISHAQTT